MRSFLTNSDVINFWSAENVCNGYFIVIPLLLTEISLNLVQEVRIRSLFIFLAQKLLLFIIIYKRDNFVSVFGHKHVLEIWLMWQQRRSLVTKKYMNDA